MNTNQTAEYSKVLNLINENYESKHPTLHIVGFKYLTKVPNILEQCTHLTELSIRRTKITELNVSMLTNLKVLYVDHNLLKKLVVPPNLTVLDYSDNILSIECLERLYEYRLTHPMDSIIYPFTDYNDDSNDDEEEEASDSENEDECKQKQSFNYNDYSFDTESDSDDSDKSDSDSDSDDSNTDTDSDSDKSDSDSDKSDSDSEDSDTDSDKSDSDSDDSDSD